MSFDDDALAAIAEKALEKETGARALRAIIEEFMLDIMYEIPKDDNIGKVRITRAYIEHTGGPEICFAQERRRFCRKALTVFDKNVMLGCKCVMIENEESSAFMNEVQRSSF